MSSKRFFKKTKKNTMDNKGSNQSPSNFRTITDPFKPSFPKFNYATLLIIYRGSLRVFIVLIFLFTAIIVGIDLQKNLSFKENIDMRRGILTKELNFWEDFIEKNQDYKDAYFQASILEYKLGNISKAKAYVEKGLFLDPNSESGKKIEEFLEGK